MYEALSPRESIDQEQKVAQDYSSGIGPTQNIASPAFERITAPLFRRLHLLQLLHCGDLHFIRHQTFQQHEDHRMNRLVH